MKTGSLLLVGLGAPVPVAAGTVELPLGAGKLPEGTTGAGLETGAALETGAEETGAAELLEAETTGALDTAADELTAAAEEVMAGVEAEVTGLWNLSVNCYESCKCRG